MKAVVVSGDGIREGQVSILAPSSSESYTHKIASIFLNQEVVTLPNKFS